MKREKITVQENRKDNGTLPLNVAENSSKGLRSGDIINIAQGQESAIASYEGKSYRSLPVYINGEATELSIRTLFGIRIARPDMPNLIKTENGFKTEWVNWFRFSRPRFKSVSKSFRVINNGNKKYFDVTDDIEIKCTSLGDMLVQDFEQTVADSETTLNKDGKTVKKFIHLKIAENYIGD